VIPVCDVSQHQGRIDFNVMRARGVKGLIFRATHGRSVDTRCAEYVRGARAAGYRDSDLGTYSFINPKRGSGRDIADAWVDAVEMAFGHTNTFYMLDVEHYATEPGAGKIIHGDEFAHWLHECVDKLLALGIRQDRIIFYTNRAYWDGPVDHARPSLGKWVGSAAFGVHDLIVARYPFYSHAAYARVGYPPADAGQWDEWIMSKTPSRPSLPTGWNNWDGWQFAAGFNRQGRVFGCESDDLDLNIVDPEAWRRWTSSLPTAPIPNPPPIRIPVEPPAEPAHTEDDDMAFRAVIKGGDAQHHPVLVVADGAGTHMTGLTDPGDVQVALRRLGQAQVEQVSNTLWEDLLQKALQTAGAHSPNTQPGG
jgi:hypothetical protein